MGHCHEWTHHVATRFIVSFLLYDYNEIITHFFRNIRLCQAVRKTSLIS